MIRRAPSLFALGLVAVAHATLEPIAPSNAAVRNVVFTLVKGGEADQGSVLAERNRCLNNALKSSEGYDLVAFHEGSVSSEIIGRMAAEAPNMRFVNVDDVFGLPHGVQLPEEVALGSVEGSLGYRKMCNFMTNEWHRLLSRYEYAMRVDEDVCLQKVNADPFSEMKRRGLVYAYGAEVPENHELTASTLPPWAQSYAAEHSLHYMAQASLTIYFTNFFISKVDWWSAPQVQEYLTAVQQSGNIFTKRWGDAPIQTVALRMLARADEVARLPTDYLHVSTMNRIFADGHESDGFKDIQMLRHPLVRAYREREQRRSFLSRAETFVKATPSIEAEEFRHGRILSEANGTAISYLQFAFIVQGQPDEIGTSIVEALTDFYTQLVSDAATPLAVDVRVETAPNDGSTIHVSLKYLTTPEAEAAKAVVEPGYNPTTMNEVFSANSVLSVPAMRVLSIERLLDDETLLVDTIVGPTGGTPPAPPPTAYTPNKDDEPSRQDDGLDYEGIIGIAIGVLVFIVVVAILVLYATKNPSPLTCSPVKTKQLTYLMIKWGYQPLKVRLAVTVAVLIIFIVLAGAGLPRIEVNQGTQSEWVAAGSRLESQIKDWENLVDSSVTDRTSAYIIISSKSGKNLIDDPEKWLNATLRVVQDVYTSATVEAPDKFGNTLTLDWKDFCFSINHPLLTEPLSIGPVTIPGTGTGDNFKPCINPSVLDPFLEATWEYANGTSIGAEKLESYNSIALVSDIACDQYGEESPDYCGQVRGGFDRPSFYGMPREEIIYWLKTNGVKGVKEDFSDSTGHWIDAASQPWGKLYGSFEGDSTAATPENRSLTYAKSFVYTLYQDIPKEVIKFRKSVKNMTAEAFKDANEDWLLAMETQLERINDDDVNFPDVRVSYYPSNAIERMYAEVSSAQAETIAVGYAVMFVFVIISQISFRKATFFAPIAAVGFVLILLGNAAAYGLIALSGYKYNHTMLQALPFIALGLGVDDLFLLLHAFHAKMTAHCGRKQDVLVALTLMEAGSSVTITSLSNACVFFVSCLIPIPAIRALLISAGVIVVFNWITAMCLLPALFAFWAKHFEETKSEDKLTPDELIKINEGDPASKDKGTEWFTCIERFYNVFASNLPLKLLFLGAGVAVLAGFASEISNVEFGVDNTDLAKRGTYLRQGINDAYEQVFSQHAAELVVFGTGIDYTVDQAQILKTHRALKDSQWSAYGTSYGRTGSGINTWLENMYGAAGVCPFYNLYGDNTDPSWAFYEDFHLWRKPQTFLEPREPYTLAFGGLFAGLLDNANSWAYSAPDGPDDYSTTNEIVLSWDEVEMNMGLLDNSNNRIQMVKDFRKITLDSGINIYMYGWLFTQLEQFLDLDWYAWVSAAASMSIIFFISLILGISWLNAMIIALFAVIMFVEVYGSLAVLDIQYQTLAATSMLMSMGISVEFVAHPVAAYEFATGTRSQRIAEAMSKTAVPVLEGAFSSLLGFLFLYFSDFDFVRKYFFYLFLMMCSFGTINALIFLPGLLGLLGAEKKESGTNVAVTATNTAPKGTVASTSASSSADVEEKA